MRRTRSPHHAPETPDFHACVKRFFAPHPHYFPKPKNLYHLGMVPKILPQFLFAALLASCSIADERIVANSSSFDTGSSMTASSTSTANSYTPDSELAYAFDHHLSNIQVLVRGKVTRILSDDTEGDRHQRFIIELQSGQTLLIAHNIDLASRIEPLSVGDEVSVFGEYEWNDQGGTIHWTHADPDGSHVEGWIHIL